VPWGFESRFGVGWGWLGLGGEGGDWVCGWFGWMVLMGVDGGGGGVVM